MPPSSRRAFRKLAAAAALPPFRSPGPVSLPVPGLGHFPGSPNGRNKAARMAQGLDGERGGNPYRCDQALSGISGIRTSVYRCVWLAPRRTGRTTARRSAQRSVGTKRIAAFRWAHLHRCERLSRFAHTFKESLDPDPELQEFNIEHGREYVLLQKSGALR
jgi:hypothetical protein